MCSDKKPDPGPSSPGAAYRNWVNSDLPFWPRLTLALSNEWIKVRTGQQCCGHYGEPGC